MWPPFSTQFWAKFPTKTCKIKWNNWFGNFLCALIMSFYTNLSYLNTKSCRNVNLFNYSENKIHTPSVSQYHIITHIAGKVLVLELVKGEIHSKINSIWKERVHFFLQNSEKIMKIGWEIRKIWHFEISHFFGKHFLTSPYEYSNERVDDVIPSQFFIYIVYKILKFFNF